MRRRPGCPLVLLLVTVGATAIVLGVIASYGNYQGGVNRAVSLALAATVALLAFLALPATRPAEPVRGTAASRTFGRALIWIAHLVKGALAAYGVYYLTIEPAVAFLPLMAGLAVIGSAMTLIGRWGRHLAGFSVDWAFLRGMAVLRYLLVVAMGAATAGYSRVLAHYWWAFVDAVPLTVYRWLRDVLGTAWLAVPGTALCCLLLLAVIAVVASVVQRIVAQLLGPRNAVSRWLTKHAAMTWVRAPEGTVFYGGPLLPFHYTSNFPNEPGRRLVDRYRTRERPLSDDEADQLLDRLAEAVLAAAPEDGSVRLTYRAAAGHEEIGLTATDTWFGDWEEEWLEASGRRSVPVDERPLPDFAEVAALRRLRESHYGAGYGAPFALHLVVQRPSEADRARGRRFTRRLEIEWSEAGAPRPAWRHPPSGAQYAADLRRFPAARRMVPLWLRPELGWRWLLPLRATPAPPPAAVTDERPVSLGVRRD